MRNHCVVFGGTGGIGSAIVNTFISNRCHVVAIGKQKCNTLKFVKSHDVDGRNSII